MAVQRQPAVGAGGFRSALKTLEWASAWAKRDPPEPHWQLGLMSGKGTARQIADAALKRLASKLKIDPKLKDLRYEKVRETILGKHVTYQQQLNHGQNQETIRSVFVRRGILPNPKKMNRRAGQPFSDTTRGGSKPAGAR